MRSRSSTLSTASPSYMSSPPSRPFRPPSVEIPYFQFVGYFVCRQPILPCSSLFSSKIPTSTMATEHSYPAATNGDAPLEKDFSQSQNGFHNDHLGAHVGSDEALRRIRTAGSISISPELFEKIYLSPQNQVKGDLRKTVGNPTPL